jgi:hypothetical protein
MNELHNVDIYNKFFYNTKIKNCIAKQIKFFLCNFFFNLKNKIIHLLLKHFCNDTMVSIIKWPPHLQLAQSKMEGGRILTQNTY